MTAPLKSATIYDKRRPEGLQEVAILRAVVEDDQTPVIVFMCQHDPSGWSWLDKQHAVEFASCLLMMALGLPGDIPAGDCGVAEPQQPKPEGR